MKTPNFPRLRGIGWLALLGLLAAGGVPPAGAAPRRSSNYSFPSEVLDSAGQRTKSASPDYVQAVGDLGTIGDAMASVNYGVTGGFAATAEDTLGPEVHTLAATGLAGTAATLNAQVTANTAATSVTFLYGAVANALDHIVAVPGVIAANSPAQTVSLVLPKGALVKDTTYYFRATAQSSAGATNAPELLPFTTTDTAPVGHDQTIYVAGDGAAFNLVKGDEDVDGDVPTVATVEAQAVDAANNSVADVSKNADGRVQVTPHAGFAGVATFHFTLTDGEKEGPTATVTVISYAFVAGSYDGYIGDGTGTSAANGFLHLTVDALDFFTASLTFGGVTYPTKGHFDDSGAVSVLVPHTMAPPLRLTLALDPVTGAITGRLVAADNSVFDAPINLLHLEDGDVTNAPQVGTYTLFLDPTGAATAALHSEASIFTPTVEGSGYAVVRIRKHNRHGQSPAAFVGLLPDSVPFSSGSMSVAIARDGQIDPQHPKRVYIVSANPYKKLHLDEQKGNVRTSPVVDVAKDTHATNLSGGNGVIFRPATTDLSKPFASGYTLPFDVNNASVITNPHLEFVQGQNHDTNARLVFSKGGILGGVSANGQLIEPLFVNRQNVVMFKNVPSDQFKNFKARINVSFAPGLAASAPVPIFSGKFVHDDGSGQVDKFHGVFVRPSNGAPFQGRGHFTGTDANGDSRSGRVDFLKGP